MQNLSKAAVASTGSSSGKVVFKNTDNLIQIRGDCASAEPLSFGADANSFSKEQESSSKCLISSSAASFLSQYFYVQPHQMVIV